MDLFGLFVLASLLLNIASGSVIDLSLDDFHRGLLSNSFDAILDTRTPTEWKHGHLVKATLIHFDEHFGPDAQSKQLLVEFLDGCKNCRIVTYSEEGERSRKAADWLVKAGFEGPIYNGGGLSQLLLAGYDDHLDFHIRSVDPPCACKFCTEKRCRATDFVYSAEAEDLPEDDASNFAVGKPLTSSASAQAMSMNNVVPGAATKTVYGELRADRLETVAVSRKSGTQSPIFSVGFLFLVVAAVAFFMSSSKNQSHPRGYRLLDGSNNSRTD